MCQVDPTVVYVDHQTLQRLADKHSLEQYMQEQTNQKMESKLTSPALWKIQLIVRQFVAELPRNKRHILYLWFWKELSEDEISHELNLDAAQVNSLLKDTLNILKENICTALRKNKRYQPRERLCLAEC